MQMTNLIVSNVKREIQEDDTENGKVECKVVAIKKRKFRKTRTITRNRITTSTRKLLKSGQKGLDSKDFEKDETITDSNTNDNANIQEVLKNAEFIDDNQEKRFKCPVCKFIFKSPSDLKRHYNIHSGERNHECDHCGKKFRLYTFLKSHIKQIHSNAEEPDGFPCDVCAKEFRNIKYLRRHVRDVHDKANKIPCGLCGLKFRSQQRLTLHREDKHQYGSEAALYQEKQARRLRNRTLIANAVFLDDDNNKRYKCFCGTIIKKRWDFLRHQLVHTKEKHYCCDLCGKMFAMKKGLTTHVDEVHKKLIRFYCEICKAKFTNKANLKNHMNTHTNNRPFVCEVCGKGFRQHGSLYRHKISHTDVFAFECDICNKKYRTASCLKIHYRSHTGERPFACSICSATFPSNCRLKEHAKIHDTSKIFICYICGNKYKLEKTLKGHLRSHKKKGEIIS